MVTLPLAVLSVAVPTLAALPVAHVLATVAAAVRVLGAVRHGMPPRGTRVRGVRGSSAEERHRGSVVHRAGVHPQGLAHDQGEESQHEPGSQTAAQGAVLHHP